MITIVLILGVVNLGLGFALAVLLERPLALPRGWSRPWRSWSAPWQRWSAQRRHAPTPSAAQPELPPEGASSSETDPFARLLAMGIEPASLAEAVLWVVKLDLVAYRQELVANEQRHRNGEADAIEAIVSRTETWHQQLSGLFDSLSSYQDEDEPALKHELEEALLDHIFQIQSCEQIERLAQRGETDEITGRICALNTAVDSLRDFVDDCLAGALRAQQRLRLIKKSLRVAPDSSALTRLGLETMFDDWCSRDEDRVRLVSCVLLDLDRFAPLNERWGHEIGDRIAVAFEVLVQELLRQGRGFDRAARISGQSLLLFLGDTGARNASSGAERMRQTLEATSFRIAEQNIELTTSCGVVELGKREQIPELLGRLRECVAQAKQAGGNRSFLDVDSGPQPVESTQYKVEGRVIEI